LSNRPKVIHNRKQRMTPAALMVGKVGRPQGRQGRSHRFVSSTKKINRKRALRQLGGNAKVNN
jgi:hypothetical protein